MLTQMLTATSDIVFAYAVFPDVMWSYSLATEAQCEKAVERINLVLYG